MAERNKAPEKELNGMEATTLPGAEFQTLAIRMVNEPRRRAETLRENFNRDGRHEKAVKNEDYSKWKEGYEEGIEREGNEAKG